MKTAEKRLVTCRCSFCNKNYEFELTEQEYKMYCEYLYEGKHLIQDVFPNRTPSERELLRGQGGMCGECWNNLFGSFEYDDDEFEEEEFGEEDLSLD